GLLDKRPPDPPAPAPAPPPPVNDVRSASFKQAGPAKAAPSPAAPAPAPAAAVDFDLLALFAALIALFIAWPVIALRLLINRRALKALPSPASRRWTALFVSALAL